MEITDEDDNNHDTDAVSIPTWDINRFHNIFNHASEDVLRATAKEKNWKLTGKFETCRHCKESNAQQKGVSRTSNTQSTKPGERLFIDITSIQAHSFGGKKFWLVVVDDATNLTWSFFLQQKNATAKEMFTLLKHLHSNGVIIKYIRCDNAGENVALETMIKTDPDLKHIQFEYTPRDSPQYNGKVERKIAILHGRVRAVLTAAGVPETFRAKLWAEAASFTTDIENFLLSKTYGSSPLNALGIDPIKPESLRQFGEIAIVKYSTKIKGKLRNRGIPVMYLGKAPSHAPDVYRVLKLDTNRVIVTRDAIWLNQTYGEYKGDQRLRDIITVADIPTLPLSVQQQITDQLLDTPTITAPPTTTVPLLEAEPQKPPVTPPTRKSSRQTKPVERLTAAAPGQLTDKATELAQAHDPAELPLVDRVLQQNQGLPSTPDSQSGRETQANFAANFPEEFIEIDIANAAMWIDKYGANFETMNDTGLAAPKTIDYTKVDPSKYKDIFNDPTSFDEAWNHPDPFQRMKWREAILKEFKKMNEQKVWKKIKGSEMPSGRRCVKHKWVFLIKRNGTFRARLVACGYSQIPGIDFNDVYSPVANDTTFRMLLIQMIVNHY